MAELRGMVNSARRDACPGAAQRRNDPVAPVLRIIRHLRLFARRALTRAESRSAVHASTTHRRANTKRRRLRQPAALILSLLILALTSLGLAGSAIADDDDDDGRRGRLATRLVGAEEFPGPGDPDGRGRACLRLNANEGTICYKLNVRRIEPATAAHIHVGAAGPAGPVVVGLEPPIDGSTKSCTTADPALIRAILNDPGAYYVNVHNVPFPAGAVRGQLGAANGDD